MKYKSFHIKNFKGIKDAKIDLESNGGASVFCLVGLNESGKTTILEAIHSFSPDHATSQLIGGDEKTGVPFKDRVPRHVISNFTGEVSVTARVSVTAKDKAEIGRGLKEDDKLLLNVDEFPDELDIEIRQVFKSGDFVKGLSDIHGVIKIKTAGQRKWRECASVDEAKAVQLAVYMLAPDIAYFPTFVFDFPKDIFLTDRGGENRQVLQECIPRHLGL